MLAPKTIGWAMESGVFSPTIFVISDIDEDMALFISEMVSVAVEVIFFETVRELFSVSFSVIYTSSYLLSDIKNSTIIFGGNRDSLMPLVEVRKLKRLIKGSKLYVTHGSHFNVFTKRNLKQLEGFLER